LSSSYRGFCKKEEGNDSCRPFFLWGVAQKVVTIAFFFCGRFCKEKEGDGNHLHLLLGGCCKEKKVTIVATIIGFFWVGIAETKKVMAVGAAITFF